MRKILFPLLLSLFFFLPAFALAQGGPPPTPTPPPWWTPDPTSTPTPGSGPSLPWDWSTPSPIPSPVCPDSPPPWWGTATPSSYWYFLCGYCVSRWPRRDPFSTPTPFLPTVVLPTVSLTGVLTSTPTVTPMATPTLTPTPTPTPTPAPPTGPDQDLRLMILDAFGPRDWWSAWYEFYSPSGYFTAPLTATQHITFSPGNLLIFHARLNALKAVNGDWHTRFVVAFTDPWSHGGSNAIIDYGARVVGMLYSDHCHITLDGWRTAGPYFRFLFRAADQEADVGDSASGDPCGVSSRVDIDYQWSGRSPAERQPWKELGFDTRWGYAYYNRGTISASVTISLSYGYSGPPPLPTPTPAPTPSPTPTPSAGDAAVCLDPNLGSGSDISDFLPVPRYHGSYCISFGPLGPYNLPVLGQVYVPYTEVCFVPVTFGEFDFLGFRFSADIFLGAIVGLALIYILMGKS